MRCYLLSWNTTWAGQILGWLARATSGLKRPVFLVGDGSYATFGLMSKAVASDVGLIVRMKMNSRLYHLAPPPVKGKRGPKSKKGKRMLSMKARFTDKQIKWQKVTFSEWYGAKDKTMLSTTEATIGFYRKHRFVDGGEFRLPFEQMYSHFRGMFRMAWRASV